MACPKAELRSPEIWIPAACTVLGTQLLAIRGGRSGGTELFRWAWTHPGARLALLAWGAVTIPHLFRFGPTRLDPYSALSHLIERKVPT